MRSFLLTIFISNTVFAEIKTNKDVSGCRVQFEWTYTENHHAADKIKGSTQTGLKTSTKKHQWELVPTGCSLDRDTEILQSDVELYECSVDGKPAETFHLKLGDPAGCLKEATQSSEDETTSCELPDSNFICRVRDFSCDMLKTFVKRLEDEGVYWCESNDDGHTVRLQVSILPSAAQSTSPPTTSLRPSPTQSTQSQGFQWNILAIAISCCGIAVTIGLAVYFLLKRFRRSKSTKPDEEELGRREVHEYDEIPAPPLPSAPQTAVTTIYTTATFPETEDSAGPSRIYTGTTPATATTITTTSAYSTVTRRTSDNTELTPKGLNTATPSDDKPTVS